MLIGKKHEDPESPSYVPTIFGKEPGRRERNSQKRYEAVKRRREKKVEVIQQASTTEEEQIPETSSDVVLGESSKHSEPVIELTKYEELESKYNALEVEYRK